MEKQPRYIHICTYVCCIVLYCTTSNAEMKVEGLLYWPIVDPEFSRQNVKRATDVCITILYIYIYVIYYVLRRGRLLLPSLN